MAIDLAPVPAGKGDPVTAVSPPLAELAEYTETLPELSFAA